MSKVDNEAVLTIAQQSVLAKMKTTDDGYQSRVSFKTYLEHKQ